jgi:hypothetical protein
MEWKKRKEEKYSVSNMDPSQNVTNAYVCHISMKKV